MSRAPNRSFFKFLINLILDPLTKFMIAIGAWSIEVAVDDSREIIGEITEIPTKIDQYTGLTNIYLLLQKIIDLLGSVPNLIFNKAKNLIVISTFSVFWYLLEDLIGY